MNISPNLSSTRFFPRWGIKCGKQITGFMELMQDIYNLDRTLDKTYVELGSNLCESALLAGSFGFIKTIYCVDRFDRDKQLSICKQRLSHLGQNKNIHFIKESTNKAYASFQNLSIDILYVDAAHDYNSVKQDLTLWYPKMKKGGFICGHDYSKTFDGVIKAVNEFTKEQSLSIHKTYIDSSYLILLR